MLGKKKEKRVVEPKVEKKEETYVPSERDELETLYSLMLKYGVTRKSDVENKLAK